MSKKSPENVQRDRFIETARELGCNEDEEAFRAKLKVIARQTTKERSESPKDDGH